MGTLQWHAVWAFGRATRRAKFVRSTVLVRIAEQLGLGAVVIAMLTACAPTASVCDPRAPSLLVHLSGSVAAQSFPRFCQADLCTVNPGVTDDETSSTALRATYLVKVSRTTWRLSFSNGVPTEGRLEQIYKSEVHDTAEVHIPPIATDPTCGQTSSPDPTLQIGR